MDENQNNEQSPMAARNSQLMYCPECNGVLLKERSMYHNTMVMAVCYDCMKICQAMEYPSKIAAEVDSLRYYYECINNS